jgi:hypothetical protein
MASTAESRVVNLVQQMTCPPDAFVQAPTSSSWNRRTLAGKLGPAKRSDLKHRVRVFRRGTGVSRGESHPRPAERAQPVSHTTASKQDNERTTVEDSVDQRGGPEGYGQEEHRPPEEHRDPKAMTVIRVAGTARVTAYSGGI